MFVSIEGPDGCGKSTIVPLVASWLRERGFPVRTTFEPGATELGRRLRQLLLQDAAPMSPMTETLLMAADRAQHVAEVVRPALAQGHIVITDRYIDSSLVYQGYAGGVPVDVVRRINEAATDSLYPHITFLLDVPFDEARRRRQLSKGDRFEARGAAFQKKVYDGFFQLARLEPQRIVIVANVEPAQEVAARIGRIIVERMEPLPHPPGRRAAADES